MADKQLTVTYVPLSLLRRNPHNPRTLSKDALEKVKESLTNNPRLFHLRPVIASSRTGDNIIWCGNTRYLAAKELGLHEVPAAILDLTEEEEQEWAIRDNVSNGEWDWDALANEWDQDALEDWGLDIPSVKEAEAKEVPPKVPTHSFECTFLNNEDCENAREEVREVLENYKGAYLK